MATLATAISTAVTKSLLAKLPSEAAEKFSLSEEEFKEFLQDFLSKQLGKASKAGRASGPKGKNGKGRISGYISFSNTNRQSVKDENPDFSFTEVGKELGKRWRELSDAEKAVWVNKAEAHNVDNGLPTPTPAAKQAKTPAAGKGRKAAAAAPEAAGDEGEMKISRHGESKSWVIQDTNLVVQSPKNKVVVGKLRGNKVVTLTSSDLKKCQANGWVVKPAPVKARAAKAKAEAESDE